MLDNVSPESWSVLILGSAALFCFLWFLDALTHKKLVHVEITVTELQTHRNILISSVLMEISLILMYWNALIMLPFFLAFFITRTAHEFIDEMKYHAQRCSAYENYLHLGMWITVLIKTFALFIWGFFYGYQGVESLHSGFFIAGIVIVILMTYVGWKEWKR